MDYAIEGASAQQNKFLQEISESFTVGDQHLGDVSQAVYEFVTAGLQSDGGRSGAPCQVSFIQADITQDIREAERQGRVALGMTMSTTGGRLKIASVKFESGSLGGDVVQKQIFFIPKDTPSAADVFEYAAVRVAEFVNSHELPANLSLGVCIDRPVDESSRPGGRVADNIDCGVLRNADLALGLNAALLKKHVPVRVTAANNCIVSTLVAAQRRFPSTSVALILNHGINISYYEAAAKIPRQPGVGRVAVNTELARFGEQTSVLQPTLWDRRLDRESADTGTHTFEKLTADKFIGEIVRNLITDFMDARLIFARDADASVFTAPYSFFASYMAIMDDSSPDLRDVGDLLRAGFNIQASLVDRQIVRALCHIVAMRAARLVGAAVAGVARKASEALESPPQPLVISISGQLSEINQPYVASTISTAKALMANLGLSEPTFTVLGEDGYTFGAALASLSK